LLLEVRGNWNLQHDRWVRPGSGRRERERASRPAYAAFRRQLASFSSVHSSSRTRERREAHARRRDVRRTGLATRANKVAGYRAAPTCPCQCGCSVAPGDALPCPRRALLGVGHDPDASVPLAGNSLRSDQRKAAGPRAPSRSTGRRTREGSALATAARPRDVAPSSRDRRAGARTRSASPISCAVGWPVRCGRR